MSSGSGPASRRVGGVVVAAGAGVRFGAPKQFAMLGGAPVAARAAGALLGHPSVGRVVVVVPPAGAGEWANRLEPFLRGAAVTFCPGGATRRESAWNGLRALLDGASESDSGSGEVGAPPDLVLVHDGARPLAPADLVERVVVAASIHGAAVPAVPVTDTLYHASGDVAVGVAPRDGVAGAQTPQGFRREVLERVLATGDRSVASGAPGTDEGSSAIAAGESVRIVAGSPRNLKITTPEDLRIAEALLGAAAAAPTAPPRIGIGMDAHRFGDGGTLRLGGIAFPGEPVLAGHSDGDALLHAVADAILGAVGAPDIGSLFPSSDPELENADSRKFVARAVEIALEAGCVPGQVDVVVVGERPRIAPRVSEMRAEVAGMLGIPPGSVGIKGTTTDGMGFAGRGEGLFAQAVARLDPVGGEPGR